MSTSKPKKKLEKYIMYSLKPLKHSYIESLYKGYVIDELKSDIPEFYKYSIRLLPSAINGIIVPHTLQEELPFLIIAKSSMYGYITSSIIIKGSNKYIYNYKYPITTKQPYRQLREHYKTYLVNKLLKSL